MQEFAGELLALAGPLPPSAIAFHPAESLAQLQGPQMDGGGAQSLAAVAGGNASRRRQASGTATSQQTLPTTQGTAATAGGRGRGRAADGRSGGGARLRERGGEEACVACV